jgi:hypothetical protein
MKSWYTLLIMLSGVALSLICAEAISGIQKWAMKRKRMRRENTRKFLRNATRWIY